jgi:S1-C subfamily serine protease
MSRSLLVGALVVLLAAPHSVAGEKEGYIGLMVKVDEVSGKIVVVSAQGDLPADKAGLKTGDIILKINDKEPANLQDFVDKVRATKPGEKVEIKVDRDGKEMTFKITAIERPKEPKP